MGYLTLLLHKVRRNRWLGCFFLLECIVVLFSLAGLENTMEYSVQTFSVVEIMNYAFELNILPMLSIWMYLYIFWKIKTSYDLQLMVQKGMPRFRLYGTHSLLMLICFSIQWLILIASFFIGLYKVSGIQEEWNYNEVLPYMGLLLLGNLFIFSFVRLLTLLLDRVYIAFMAVTGVYLLERFNLLEVWSRGIANPMNYSRVLFFRENRPSLAIMFGFSLIGIGVLWGMTGCIFQRKCLGR